MNLTELSASEKYDKSIFVKHSGTFTNSLISRSE